MSVVFDAVLRHCHSVDYLVCTLSLAVQFWVLSNAGAIAQAVIEIIIQHTSLDVTPRQLVETLATLPYSIARGVHFPLTCKGVGFCFL
jgi:hypothetical protein